MTGFPRSHSTFPKLCGRQRCNAAARHVLMFSRKDQVARMTLNWCHTRRRRTSMTVPVVITKKSL